MDGTACHGNLTASAKFNVLHDSETIAIMFGAAAEFSVPVTMDELDVFCNPVVARTETARCSQLAGRLIEFQCAQFNTLSATIDDTGVMCAVLGSIKCTARFDAG